MELAAEDVMPDDCVETRMQVLCSIQQRFAIPAKDGLGLLCLTLCLLLSGDETLVVSCTLRGPCRHHPGRNCTHHRHSCRPDANHDFGIHTNMVTQEQGGSHNMLVSGARPVTRS